MQVIEISWFFSSFIDLEAFLLKKWLWSKCLQETVLVDFHVGLTYIIFFFYSTDTTTTEILISKGQYSSWERAQGEQYERWS